MLPYKVIPVLANWYNPPPFFFPLSDSVQSVPAVRSSLDVVMIRVCSELKFAKDFGHLRLFILNPSIWFHPIRSRSFTFLILLVSASTQGETNGGAIGI